MVKPVWMKALLTILFCLVTASLLEAACPDSCVLAWQDNSNDEDGFYVYQKINLGAYTKTTIKVPANAKSVTLPALPAPGTSDTTYCWGLTSYNKATQNNGESAMTTDVACHTVAAAVLKPPAAPSGVTVTMETFQGIRLSWRPNSIDHTSFDIQQQMQQQTGPINKVITGLPPDITYYEDTGLASLTTYCYRVRAVRNKEVSAYSADSSCGTTLAK